MGSQSPILCKAVDRAPTHQTLAVAEHDRNGDQLTLAPSHNAYSNHTCVHNTFSAVPALLIVLDLQKADLQSNSSREMCPKVFFREVKNSKGHLFSRFISSFLCLQSKLS
jgi:hypothetical protein